jgi:hypothetical protein
LGRPRDRYGVSDRMSYIIVRDPLCDIIVLNVHAPIEDKIDDIVTCINIARQRIDKHVQTNTQQYQQCSFGSVLCLLLCKTRQKPVR